jgi:hypothetical protein
MLATPVAAQAPAPATTAFDGTYAGVSRTLEGAMHADPNGTRTCTVPNGQPGPLTIAGGVVRWPDHAGGTAEGSVNAQGVLVVHTSYGARIDAQIDGRGTVMGRYNSFCSYQMVWRKEGKWTLSAEAALDEGYGDIEPAVAGEIFVSGRGREPALAGLGCGVEHGAAKAQ